MSMEITVVGNLAADPELRFTPSGSAVANFTIAHTPRVKKGDDYEDGEVMWFKCAAWQQMAENVAESFTKGQRVIVTGRLKTERYTTNEGVERTNMVITVEDLGHSIKWATSKQTRNEKNGGGGRSSSSSSRRQPVSDDPWASAAPYPDEPPF